MFVWGQTARSFHDDEHVFPPKLRKTSVLINLISSLVTLNAGAAFQTCRQYLNGIFFKEYGGEGLVFLVHTTTQRSTGCWAHRDNLPSHCQWSSDRSFSHVCRWWITVVLALFNTRPKYIEFFLFWHSTGISALRRTVPFWSNVTN